MMNKLRVLFINFQKSEVNDDYLREFQERVATFDDYKANVLDLISCLVKDEVKETYNKDITYAKIELEAAKESIKRRLWQCHC